MQKWLCLLVCAFYLAPLRADLVTGKDNVASLPFWEWRDDMMSVRFVQRLPDQSRAYFAGRGFASKEVEFIASHCIFQTVYTNISTANRPRVIKYDVRDWHYHYRGKDYTLQPREDWKPTWQQREVPTPQIVAYEWSLLPSRQVFEAGDYNWGMTVFDVPHGERFDLTLHWQADGKPRSATINGITCARDVYIPPGEAQ